MTTGAAGLTADEIQQLPALKLICSLGAGYEAIDVAYARSRGIEVSYGPNTNSDAVADHAFALTLAAIRRLLPSHEAVCKGIQRNALPMPAQLHGKRLGLLGLGEIGSRIAKRAGGFDMEIGYHARRERPDVNCQYFDDLHALALWADVLVLAAPGSPQMEDIVTASVIEALGPSGYLVNVARGSLVDQNALVRALAAGTLGAAALGVYANEPDVPVDLIGQENVPLTPHIAGRAPESMDNMVGMVLQNIDSFMAGKGAISPVPS